MELNVTDFHLTRRVFLQLQEIEKRSLKNWSSAQTSKYMADIYKGFGKIAANPNQDAKRFYRSDPFFIQPAGVNHFALYHRFDDCVIIGAIFGQVQNIEHEITKLKCIIQDEINTLHTHMKSRSNKIHG